MEDTDSSEFKATNNIRDISSFKQLRRVNLDLESPRLEQACFKLGIKPEELLLKEKSEFENKKLQKDVIDLRYKHFMARLIDTINRVLKERREIILKERKKQKAGTSSHSGKYSPNYSPNLVHKRRSGSVEMSKPNEDLMMSTQPILNRFGLPELKVSQSIQRVREKKTKIFLMDDNKGKKRVEQYQKKWKDAQKQKNKILKSHVDKIQQKEKKRLESLQKYQQIEKAHQRRARQDHKKYIERCKLKEINRKEKEKERYLKLKRQEEEFKEKRDQIVTMKKEKEIEEIERSEKLLSEIVDKMNSSVQKEKSLLESTKKKAKKFNDIATDRFIHHKKKETLTNKQKKEKLLRQELKKLKKINNLHKSCTDLWDSIKKKHNEKFEHIKSNRAKVGKMKKKRINQLVRNKNKSQEVISEHMRKVQHDIMLKQELRKLREQDIQLTIERNKRLVDIKKEEIIEKNLKSSQVIQDVKNASQVIQKKIVENNVKELTRKRQTFMT
ncbi:unnamed protein product [Moneuplotes crassus]|uniref:Uncharacterized protein n=2 Tax=Euplotes crassus TaxID=5936 RepID=A0AAD1UC08_EUPCR|nr:unnamed protein product [Moneuplotes crassus]